MSSDSDAAAEAPRHAFFHNYFAHNVRQLRGSDTTLTELSLASTSLGEDRWRELGEALSDNSTLTNLDLGYCGITAAGAAHLAEGVGKSASLATLDLWSNKIGDSGAQALCAALVATSTLTSLNLRNCRITAAGVAHLAEGVGKSASLATLNLRSSGGSNHLGDSGAQALGAALAATSTLTSLNLGYCGFTAAGAAHLAEGVRQGPPRRVPLTLHGVDLGRVAAQVGLGDTAGGWDTEKVLAALNVKCAAARSSGAETGGLGPGARGGVGEGAAAEAAGAGGRGGGGGEGGGYGGYNYGAPSYNPPPVAWPGQPSFMNGHSGFGGGPFMQAPNGYGAPQMGGYLGMQGLNIPAGAMYNGRPINSSNANSVFGSNTAARQSQQSASHPAPPQKSSTNGYPQSYNQGNTPTYAQQPYVVPQPRGTLFEVHAWCSSSLRVPL